MEFFFWSVLRKHEICEKKQADLGHRPITRYQAYELIHARWAMLGAAEFIIPEAFNKFGANCGLKVVWFKEEIKKPSDGFGDCIFIDEEFKSSEEQADQPEPMFIEQPEAIRNEANDMVEMEDIMEEPLVDIESCDLIQ
ncbi:G2/mitotic-specific cyclin-1-like [Argentina anserina]|uniref:G2/mitotic-specific cyclin-1-like n=1 Tax=Argentina anserina TaxID=57926 RepID=UPI0021764E8A|nr:G2/mitotic-specific cyclin-1-like [Potentilla anserina]